MVHNVEAIPQTILIIGTDHLAVERLQAGFADVGWFVLVEQNCQRALGLMEHLTVSAVCIFDESNDLESDVTSLKNNTQGMLFVLSDNLCADQRLAFYNLGVSHVFVQQALALEVRTVITTLQQQQLMQSLPNINPILEARKWHFCSQSRVLSVDEKVIGSLSYSEAKILKMLIDNRNETLSRERLMMALGRFRPNPEDRTLDRLICNLRKKFKKVCPNTQFILSLYGHGYVFTSPNTTQI